MSSNPPVRSRWRRGLSALLAVGGAVGLLIGCAGAVGCWVAHSRAVRLADRSFGRADDAIGTVRDGLAQAGDRLRDTRAKWDSLRRRDGDWISRLQSERDAVRRAGSELIVLASPRLVEARLKLAKATEMAHVLNGHLEALADLPLGERIGVETDQLREAADQLGELIARSEKLSVTLEKVSTVPYGDAPAEVSRIVGLMDRIVGSADAGVDRVDSARERVRARHARVVGWFTAISVGATILLGWIVLGQLSLLLRGCGRYRVPVEGANLP